MSRPWCELAQAEIRTCNLPIANPALYHTATSAPVIGLQFITLTNTGQLITLRAKLRSVFAPVRLRVCVCVCVCLFVCGSALLQPARSVCVTSERFFIVSAAAEIKTCSWNKKSNFYKTAVVTLSALRPFVNFGHAYTGIRTV